MRHRLAVIAAALLLVACKDGTGPDGPDLTGRWEGYGGCGQWVLNIHDYDGRLVGYGTVAGCNWVNISVSGTRRGSTVALNLTHADFYTARFNGQAVTATRLAGRITESGFNDSMQVDKQ